MKGKPYMKIDIDSHPLGRIIQRCKELKDVELEVAKAYIEKQINYGSEILEKTNPLIRKHELYELKRLKGKIEFRLDKKRPYIYIIFIKNPFKGELITIIDTESRPKHPFTLKEILEYKGTNIDDYV